MIRAKKHLGQHFLTSPQTVTALAEAVTDTSLPVIEIGPGTGVLTAVLLERFEKVYAIEKDPELVAKLEDTFADAIADGRLVVIEDDALSFDPDTWGVASDYVVVGNIPYYITGALFRTILSHDQKPTELAFLIQREVAERIVERDGKSSVLSLSVSCFGTPRIVTHVKPGAFTPPPKVDSSIVHVADISNALFTEHNVTPDQFFDAVKRGFAHKRKKLRNNLNIDADQLTAVGIDSETRAENVALPDWFKLVQ